MSDYLKDGMERTYDTTQNGETIYRDVTGNESYEDSYGYLNPIDKPTSRYGANDEFEDSSYGGTTDGDTGQSENRIGYQNDPDLYINGSRFSRIIDVPDYRENKKWYMKHVSSNNSKQPISKLDMLLITVFIIIATAAAIWIGFHVIKIVLKAFSEFLDQIW